ncbi:MAG: hypothetical protein WKF63_10870 [Thermomicrobiales bacterium]
MELRRLLAVKLTTLDGEYLTASDIIVRPSVFLLIDAYQAKPDRSAAEISWVRERLDQKIDLLLILPGRAANQARLIRPGNNTRMFLDADGEFRQLISPSGNRRAVLVVPEARTIERLSGTSSIFAVGHHHGGTEDRGADRTIDLGDVYH